MIDIGNHQHGYLIAEEAGVVYNPASDICVSRVRDGDGQLLGGVIFTDWTGSSMTMHVASFAPRWINPDMLFICFDYPFNQIGCTALFGYVKVTNQHALDFDLKLGFKEVARVADVYPEGDMVVLKMLREECRWLNIKPKSIMRGSRGQEVESSAVA